MNGRIEKENCWISQGLNFTAACDALKTVIGTDDVEPDQNNRVKDISAFPKRLRFYHAIIDSRSLKSGEDFGKLKQVYVIFICNYDPFGYDRVLYTIKKRCLEEPEMEYDDGFETIVLYTKGTFEGYPENGGCSQARRGAVITVYEEF